MCGENHVVAGDRYGIDNSGTLRFGVPFEPLEFHPGERAVLDHKALRRVIDNDFDALFFGVVKLPG